MENKEKVGFTDRIWNFFASVKLAIVILITLALTSIIGTIVEQSTDPANNIKLLSKIFGVGVAPSVYNIFLKMGFMNMYHSWWFVSLLIIFCTNLIVCSLERLPKTLQLINIPMNPLREDALRALPMRKELSVNANIKTVRDKILNSLSASGYRVFEATEENAIELYSQKGRHTRLGVYVVHLSILLIFVGAIIGARFGFGGFLNLPEGGSSDVAYTREGKPIPLGFTIKCNWYNTEYYAGSDTPQEFQSELVIIENGREVLKRTIEVNSPLTYKGITFYQSSYGMVPDIVGEFILKATNKGGQDKLLYLKLGDIFKIHGTNIKGTIVDFSPAIARDPETGALYTYAEQMVNPALKIQFKGLGEEQFAGWILKRYPETGILPTGDKIEFVDYWGVEYTGLQVSKDPGVGLIYFACIVMTIGLYIAFFKSHKKVWVRLTDEKGFVRISLGGSVNKNRLSFERDMEKILSKALQGVESSPQQIPHIGKGVKNDK